MPSKVRVLLLTGMHKVRSARDAERFLQVWLDHNTLTGYRELEPLLPRWRRLYGLWEFCRHQGYGGKLLLFRERRGLRGSRSEFLKKGGDVVVGRKPKPVVQGRGREATPYTPNRLTAHLRDLPQQQAPEARVVAAAPHGNPVYTIFNTLMNHNVQGTILANAAQVQWREITLQNPIGQPVGLQPPNPLDAWPVDFGDEQP